MRLCLALLLSPLLTALAPVVAQAAVPDQVIVQSQRGSGIGTYLYFPFTVPDGVNRITVKITKGSPDAKTGAGLFDERGAAYGSRGFRGIYGEEVNDFYVASDSASRAFVAGPIKPGTWTTVVPLFTVPTPTTITATMTFSFGPQGTPPAVEPVPEVVSPTPGWYRGDLHDHTSFSSDAFGSGSALDPAAFVRKAKGVGLDFVSLTDHNVTAQNDHLAADQPSAFLTLAGEEVTNWFHGHSTATGLQSGEHFDWRWRPGNLPLDPAHEARVQEYLGKARPLGVYTSVAHPAAAQLSWQSFGDAALDPLALPDGLEVWTGQFQPDDQASVNLWDDFLRQGRRLAINGGSDIHGMKNATNLRIGTPTTVAYAQSLSRTGIVAALRNGRTYLTDSPTGPELYFTATGPQGQRTYTGGTIYGAETDNVPFSVLVRGGAGNDLRILRDGVVVQTTPITTGAQTVALSQPVLAGGYVRVELAGAPTIVPGNPLASDLGMRAMTNPIFLKRGAVPAGTAPEDAPAPERPVGGPNAATGPSGQAGASSPSVPAGAVGDSTDAGEPDLLSSSSIPAASTRMPPPRRFRAALRARRGQSRRSLRRRGLLVQVGCDHPCRTTITVQAGGRKLARRIVTLTRPGRREIALRIAPPRRGALQLTTTARSTNGVTLHGRLRVQLRR